MENRYDYQCGTSDQDPPWINAPNNGGDCGDLIDIAAELNRLRDALIRLNNAVVARMSADEPTPGERLELLRASEHACAVIGQNAEPSHR